MSYQQIAEANGITEPVNGSWIQAICEQLGITEMVNGSWTQALAQYGPFPEPVVPLPNESVMVDFMIYDYQPGAGPKGSDLYSFVMSININTLEENCIMLITDNRNGFNVDAGFGFTNYVATSAGPSTGRLIIRENVAVAPGFTTTYDMQTQIIDTVGQRVSVVNVFPYTLQPPA